MAAVGAPPAFHVAATMAYFTSSGQGSSSSSGTPLIGDLHGEPTMPFNLSEFMLPDDVDAFLPPPVAPSYGDHQTAASAVASAMADAGFAHDWQQTNSNLSNLANSTGRSAIGEGSRSEESSRIAFRMKSEVEIVDDGFKWRKYGKKSVKNSPNPRNYYRCSTEGCSVKKRVERDREDPSYVITTYDGIHNHMSPGLVYYTTQDRVTGQYYVAGCEMPPASS